MNVRVTLVVFKWHREPDKLCSYCPEFDCFIARKPTVDEVVSDFKGILLHELQNRFYDRNLWEEGWQITENSVVPPTFTPEQAVEFAEKSYETKITEPAILAIDVEVPKAERRRNIPGFYRCT